MQVTFYEVTVSEIAYNGERAPLHTTTIRGKGAQQRALDFAAQEAQRSSVLGVSVYRSGGKRPSRGAIWRHSNADAVCPCNDPRCTSVWSAGKIRDGRWYASSIAVATGAALVRERELCQPLSGCSGNAGWQRASAVSAGFEGRPCVAPARPRVRLVAA